MRTALIAISLFTVSIAHAAANRMDCADVVIGEGVTVSTKVTFDSAKPSLTHTMKLEFKGNPPLSSDSVFLSADSVCGLKLDFAKNCKPKEKYDSKFGYAYSFTCGNDVKNAELYCDENCFTSAGGGGTFRCEGPNVDKKLAGGGLPIAGCKFTKGG